MLMFHSLGALASWEIPASGSPPHLCTESLCSLQGWPLGVSSKVRFYGSSPCSCKCCRVAEAHVYFHTGWKNLCANLLGFANLFLGLAILALHPRGLGSVHRGFLARQIQLWSKAMVNPYWALLGGSFPTCVSDGPYNLTFKLGIVLGCRFDVNLPSQTPGASVFIWNWYPFYFFL